VSDFYRLSCPETGALLELRGRTFILGRSGDCDLQVTTRGVSRRHLALEVDQGELFVEDLESANGTFVNGHRCRGRRALRSRDSLRVANVEFMVLGPGESEDATMIMHPNQPPESSYVIDVANGEGDVTSIFDRYPLPANWLEEAEEESDQSSLRGMEREFERQLLREGLKPGDLPAAFWRTQPGKGEARLLRVTPSSSHQWTLGRSDQSDVVLADVSVSQSHAQLNLSRHGWQLSDLDSSNGTFINGRRIDKTSALVSGDVVALGSAEMIFRSLIKQ
jgi:pSer/pThr/pTyr-binding forkhead associated (FHA) protein